MRGPRMRGRSDGGDKDDDCPGDDGSVNVGTGVLCPSLAFEAIWRLRPDFFVRRSAVISPLTSARKRAIVSMLTGTSTVASSSRISRNDAPFSRSSMMPSLSGINFAWRMGDGRVNARTASRKRCVRAAMSVGSLILLAGVQRQVGFRSMATG
jgi:hypothetical protein